MLAEPLFWAPALALLMFAGVSALRAKGPGWVFLPLTVTLGLSVAPLPVARRLLELAAVVLPGAVLIWSALEAIRNRAFRIDALLLAVVCSGLAFSGLARLVHSSRQSSWSSGPEKRRSRGPARGGSLGSAKARLTPY